MENEINEQINQQVQPVIQTEEELKINQYVNPIKHSFDEAELDDKLRIDIMNQERTFQKGRSSKRVLRGPQLYKQHVDDVDENIKQFKEATQRDSLKAYLDEKTQKNLSSSSWLSKQAFPSEEDLNKEMDKAAETVFGSAAISKSQRTKRGQKFKEKAKLQAKMMNELNAYIWKREAAMDTALKIGRESFLVKDITAEAIQNDTVGEQERIGRSATSFAFFHQLTGDMKKNDRFGVMAKDMAMYDLFKDESVLEDRLSYHKKAKETALLLSNMYNKKETYQEQAVKILQDFKNLDLSQFDYQSNEDFLAGQGERSFAGRFASLRMFSHSLTLLIDLKDNQDAMERLTGETEPQKVEAAYEALRMKAELIREIAQDYESRALMIQSPYFALLASKDADALSIEELEKRRDTTEDEPAKMYLTELIHQRRRKGFGRGRSAAEVYNERLASAERKRQEEERNRQEEPVEIEQHAQQEVEVGADVLRQNLRQSTKFFGDSSKMKAVKRDFFALEELENTTVTAENISENVEILESAYRKAIDSCDSYLADRKGDSQTAKDRRKLVESARTQCIKNLEALAAAEMLVGTDKLYLKDQKKLSDIIMQTKIFQLFDPREKKAMARERTSLKDSAGLADFFTFLKPDTKTVRKGKAAKQYADEISMLRRELKSLPAGKAISVYMKIAGVQTVFAVDEKGGLTIHYGDEKAHLQESVRDIIHLLDHKMIEEQDKMNPQDMEEVIYDQNVNVEFLLDADQVLVTGVQKSAGDIQRASTNLARFLELKTGKAAVFFSNLDPVYLRWIAMDLIRGADPEVIAKQVERASLKTQEKTINTRETLQLIKEAEKKKTEVEQKVEYHREEKTEEETGWKKDEKAALDFISDVIFSQETWKADDTLNDPGERMWLMLDKHFDVIARLALDEIGLTESKMIDQIGEKMPLQVSGVMFPVIESLKAFLTEFCAVITEDPQVTKFLFARAMKPTTPNTLPETDISDAVRKKLRERLDKKDEVLINRLKKLETQIEANVDSSLNMVQLAIEQNVNNLFKTKEADPQNVQVNEQQNVQANVQQNAQANVQLDKEEKLKKEEQQLKDLMQDSIKGDTGQGKFIKLIFQNYFKSVGLLDKRSMLGAAIRNISPVKDRQDLSPAEIEKLEAQERGEFIGGILKGAGPLFQKILQGLPMDGVDESIRTALEDMKSKLAPIPDEIVKAQLFGMVERSGGKIEKIEVVKALGAASVGQTFLCKMYGPSFPEGGRDVVVKLLKPDVRNRMMREKKVLLECARNTDTSGGMEATYLGQLSRIEEELDLTIESRNVIMGSIYDVSSIKDTETDHVRSVKLEEQVKPTVNAMMLEMAPGTTVDQYRKELIQKREARDLRLKRKEDEDLTPFENQKSEEAKKEMALRNIKYLDRLFEERKEIHTELKKLQKRQVYLVNLARKWVKEGIFGEGFYHGDLHAGNIMINDEGATVIDFGNATKLSEEQQIQVTRMVAAAAVGDAETYQEGLHALIKPEFEQVYQNQKEQLAEELSKIFALGSSKSAGLRIAVSLLKAQELGIEVPSSIHNFSQCQLRLQNSIDDLITEITELEKQLGKMDKEIWGLDQSLLDFDLFTEMMIGLGGGYVENEKPEELLKRELLGVGVTVLRADSENVKHHLPSLQGGIFHNVRLAPLEDGGTGVKTMDDAKTMIIAQMQKFEGPIREMKEGKKEEIAAAEKSMEELDQKFIYNPEEKTEKELKDDLDNMLVGQDRDYVTDLFKVRDELVAKKMEEEAEKNKEEWEKFVESAGQKALDKEKDKLEKELREKFRKDPEVLALMEEEAEEFREELLEGFVQDGLEQYKMKAGKRALSRMQANRKKQLRAEIKNDPEFIQKMNELKEKRKNEILATSRRQLFNQLKGDMDLALDGLNGAFAKLKLAMPTDSCKKVIENCLKALVYEKIDATDFAGFVNEMNNYIESKVKSAKDVLTAYGTANLVLMDKKKTQEEKEAATKTFLQEYKKIGAYYSTAGNTGLTSIRMIQYYLHTPELFQDKLQIGIDRWEKDDAGNQPLLKELYQSFCDIRDNHPENAAALLPLEDQIVERIMKLSMDKVRPVVEDLDESYAAKVDDFLVVMGETIEENLKTALDRMGWFKSMKYSKLLKN